MKSFVSYLKFKLSTEILNFQYVKKKFIFKVLGRFLKTSTFLLNELILYMHAALVGKIYIFVVFYFQTFFVDRDLLLIVMYRSSRNSKQFDSVYVFIKKKS